MDEDILLTLDIPSLWECMVDAEFKELKNVLEVSEEYIGEELEKSRKWYEDERKKVDSDLEDSLDEYAIPLIEEKEAMISVMRTSLFSMTFAIFEKKLNDFCDEYARKRGLQLKVTDIHGNGIKRARLYLKKVVGMTFNNTKEWQEILVYNDIRNCILHNGSIAKKDHLEVFKSYDKKSQCIKIDEQNRITLNKEFCFKAIQTAKTFLLDLPSPWDDQSQKSKKI